MQQVERHIKITNEFNDICHKSGLLYNFTLYQLLNPYYENQKTYRDAVTKKKIEIGLKPEDKLNDEQLKSVSHHLNTKVKYPKINDFIDECVKNNQFDYRNLPAQTSIFVIKQVYNSFKGFWASLKEYKKNPNKFDGLPKPPKYKKGLKHNLVVFTNQQVKVKDGFIHFPRSVELQPLKTNVEKVDQVRIVPQATCYVVEVVYTVEGKNLNLNEENILTLDVGLNNLLTSCNNVGLKPFIVNGKHIKSFNKFWNKRLADAKSFIGVGTSKRQDKLNFKRNNWMQNKMHHISRFVVNYCIEHNIGRIIIGKNDGWKQLINLGSKTNQDFVQIPMAKLIEMITYKAELVGIGVELTEESYTSKVDHFAFEEMKHQVKYLGKRVRRGLFQSSVGKLLNADVNGAIGIARKVVGDSFVEKILGRGFVCNPFRLTI